MEETFREQVFSLISTINIADAERSRSTENNLPKQTLVTSHTEPKEFSDTKKEVGRNDPCPCGAINPATGEIYKYKKCGLINASQHRKSLVN